MPNRHQVCAWMLACGVMPALAVAQDRTERDIVELILRAGPRAAAIRAETEVVRREQLARLAYPNPAVQYSREGAGFTEFLQVEQSLPLFGVRAALSRAGVAATSASEAERDARLWHLRCEAALAVSRAAAEQDRAAAADALVTRAARVIDVLRTREREGEGSRFDRLRAEQEWRDARHAAASAAVALTTARAAIAAMLPPTVTLDRVIGDRDLQQPAPPLDALIARATSSRPELRALRHAADQADREADAARRLHLPSPTVFGGLKRADDPAGREHGGVFGVNVSIPLFDSGARAAARWSAERTRIEAERAVLERQMHTDIVRDREAVTLRQRALADDDSGAAEDLMRIADVAYGEGDAGILELLDALRTAARAQMRSIEIRLEARLAQIALERAVGDVLWP